MVSQLVRCTSRDSCSLLMICEIEASIWRSSVFLDGGSAAVSKRDFSVTCWILLLERAPCGLAKQLHLEYSQHGKYVILDTEDEYWI